MPQVLYRATGSPPWTGYGSFWARHEHHARRYLRMPGFGGPVLYRAEVAVDTAPVLDLRADPWRVLGNEFGLDRDDYGPGELDHEIYWSLARVLAAAGYAWVRFLSGPTEDFEEWMYLDTEALPAAPLARGEAGKWPYPSTQDRRVQRG